MKNALLIARMLESPWAMTREMLATMTRVVVRHAFNVAPTAEVLAGVEAEADVRAARKDAAMRAGGGAIAVIPFYGVAVQHGATVDNTSGGGLVSTERTGMMIRAAAADETVSGIVLDIDSPGGSVFGTPELADIIMQARSSKPIYGVANSLAASAAYWVGCSCSELYVTPSGQVGSIGVYIAHEDVSKALDEMGVKVSLISAGKFKTEGNQFEPLSDEARANIQAMVDNYYAMFTKGVAKARSVPIGQVRDGMGQGRCLMAADAVAAGMVDGIATFESVIGKMAKDLRASRQPAARANARARDIEINGG